VINHLSINISHQHNRTLIDTRFTSYPLALVTEASLIDSTTTMQLISKARPRAFRSFVFNIILMCIIQTTTANYFYVADQNARYVGADSRDPWAATSLSTTTGGAKGNLHFGDSNAVSHSTNFGKPFIEPAPATATHSIVVGKGSGIGFRLFGFVTTWTAAMLRVSRIVGATWPVISDAQHGWSAICCIFHQLKSGPVANVRRDRAGKGCLSHESSRKRLHLVCQGMSVELQFLLD
jgi:hypothetical protein